MGFDGFLFCLVLFLFALPASWIVIAAGCSSPPVPRSSPGTTVAHVNLVVDATGWDRNLDWAARDLRSAVVAELANEGIADVYDTAVPGAPTFVIHLVDRTAARTFRDDYGGDSRTTLTSGFVMAGPPRALDVHVALSGSGEDRERHETNVRVFAAASSAGDDSLIASDKIATILVAFMARELRALSTPMTH